MFEHRIHLTTILGPYESILDDVSGKMDFDGGRQSGGGSTESNQSKMSSLSFLINNAVKQVFAEKPDTAEEFASQVLAILLGNAAAAEEPAKKTKKVKSEEPKEKKARPPMSDEHKAKLLFAAKVARDPAVKKAKEDLKAGSITKEEFEAIKSEVGARMSPPSSVHASDDEAEPKPAPKPAAKAAVAEPKPDVIVIPAGPAVKAAAVAEKKAAKKADKKAKKEEKAPSEDYVAAEGDDQFDYEGDIYMVSKTGKVFETHEDDEGELIVGKQVGNMGFGKFAGMKESHRMKE